MRKFQVTLKGTGQLNGQIRINHSFEVDDSEVGNYTGQNKDDYAFAKMNEIHPGIEIPHRLSVNVVQIKEKKKSKKEKKKSKSVFKGNILFLPFRIFYRTMKWIFRNA